MIKKILILCSVMMALLSVEVFADARSDLQSRLNKIKILRADFSQKVYDAQNTLIQEGQGEMWLKRPNLFRWHMITPDESILVSDGKTLWFYNPFVEQVTATWLKNATENTPFMLIAQNSTQDWLQYSIIQVNDRFDLTPKSKKSSRKPFSITITADGVIRSFIAKEDDGQRSVYELRNQTSTGIETNQFSFTPPAGVTVDDQR